MAVPRLFVLLTGLIVLVSCKKENDDPGNDPRLQNFWKLSGYYDGNGNQINLPGFNPDTLFHYEVNLFFLWNDYSKRYEIQGQGPFDIFWGEYLIPGDKLLNLRTLETTNAKSDFQGLNSYDSLFFHTLREVEHYSVENNKLKLFYGTDLNYLLFELKPGPYPDAEQYITAEINGMKWKGDQDYTSAYVTYDYHSDQFIFGLGGTSQETLSDGLHYDISFILYVTPGKKEFILNSKGIVIDSQGGTSGICYGRYKDQYHVDTRSESGVIAITLINRSFIEGYFYFEAKGIGDNVDVINKITDGKFFIQLNSPANWFQPYEFKN